VVLSRPPLDFVGRRYQRPRQLAGLRRTQPVNALGVVFTNAGVHIDAWGLDSAAVIDGAVRQLYCCGADDGGVAVDFAFGASDDAVGVVSGLPVVAFDGAGR
jgi:hypothetical protein